MSTIPDLNKFNSKRISVFEEDLLVLAYCLVVDLVELNHRVASNSKYLKAPDIQCLQMEWLLVVNLQRKRHRHILVIFYRNRVPNIVAWLMHRTSMASPFRAFHQP